MRALGVVECVLSRTHPWVSLKGSLEQMHPPEPRAPFGEVGLPSESSGQGSVCPRRKMHPPDSAFPMEAWS